MDLGLFNVSDTYQYVLNQSGANAITLGNGNSVNWNSAGVVTLAGDQTIVGTKTFTNSIAFNGNITVTASTVNEGGQLTLLGGGSSYPVYFDNYDGNARIFGGSGPSVFATFKPNGIVSIGGNVGIGTDNPVSSLDVRGLIANYVGPAGTQQILQNWGYSNAVPRWKPVIEANASFAFYGYDAAGGTPASRVAIMNNNGNVGIGTTSPTSKLDVAGQISAEGGSAANPSFNISSPDNRDTGMFGPADGVLAFSVNASEKVRILSNGNVGIGRSPLANRLEVEGAVASKTSGTTWATNSDKRIKKAINTITDALEKICKVRLVKFKYTDEYKKDHPSIEDIEYLNVIAQEFAEVFPNDVKESGEKMPDGSPILQVDIHPLTIYSAAAIQELKQIIDSQNLRISELESKLL